MNCSKKCLSANDNMNIDIFNRLNLNNNVVCTKVYNENQIRLSSTSERNNDLPPARIYAGSPFVAAGNSMKHIDINSKLLGGESTMVKKGCGISDMSINTFTPLVPCIQRNIQNTEHIIPTFWTLGGYNSRSIIRNIDYLKQCNIRK